MTKPLGLSDSQIGFVENTLKFYLKDKTKYSVAIFGSRVRGDYRKYSDLDLWIESDPSFSRSEEVSLRNVFEESDLAIKVDIVTPDSCLESYLENIRSEKQVWFSSIDY